MIIILQLFLEIKILKLSFIQAKLDCMLEVSTDSLANINDAILVNLKPNEDFETNSNPFMPMSAMDALLSGKNFF